MQSVTKNPCSSKLGTDFCYHFAEEEGFEPPVRCRTTVFKTAAIDHSAIPPETDCKFSEKCKESENIFCSFPKRYYLCNPQ